MESEYYYREGLELSKTINSLLYEFTFTTELAQLYGHQDILSRSNKCFGEANSLLNEVSCFIYILHSDLCFSR